MIITTEKVRFYETDMMGIVHHSNQIRWFECGRCAYFDAAGLDLFELMDEGILFPIKNITCDYINPINFNDVIDIETRLTKLTRHKWSLHTGLCAMTTVRSYVSARRRTFLHTKKITALPACRTGILTNSKSYMKPIRPRQAVPDRG